MRGESGCGRVASSLGDEFDAIYHDVGTAIGNVKAIANLLSASDQHNCNTNSAGYTLERILIKAEEFLSQIWKFHLEH